MTTVLPAPMPGYPGEPWLERRRRLSRDGRRQAEWIRQWNEENSLFRDAKAKYEWAKRKRPKYVPVRILGPLMDDSEELALWKNRFDAIGYGIQRTPAETRGMEGTVLWFQRRD